MCSSFCCVQISYYYDISSCRPWDAAQKVIITRRKCEMKNCKKLIAIIVIAALAISSAASIVLAEPAYPEVPSEYDGYVTVSVSADTIGWGYLIAPTLVPIHEGESVAEATIRLFDTLGVAYEAGTPESFYLTDVACDNCVNGAEPNVPDYLMEQIELYPAWAEENFGFAYGEWTGTESGNGMLGTDDFSTFGGWMIAEDDITLPTTAGDYSAQSGHVYQWAFSVYGWGMDLGWSDGWGSFPVFDNPAEGVNRADAEEVYALIMADEELAALVAEDGMAYDEFESLVAALVDLSSTQAEIDSCLNMLLNALDGGALMGDINGDGVVNMQDAQLAMRYAIGIAELSDEQLSIGDINGDGIVNSSDATMIARIALNLI